MGIGMRKLFGGKESPPPSLPPSPPPAPVEEEAAEDEEVEHTVASEEVGQEATAAVSAEEEVEENDEEEEDTAPDADTAENNEAGDGEETSATAVEAAAVKEEQETLAKHLRYDYVLVGAGTASYAALKEILERDPDASVLLIGDEEVEPYMRPPLTKDVWIQPAGNDTASSFMYHHNGKRLSLRYHTNRWYDKLENVDTMFGMAVKSVNPNAKMLVLDNKQSTVVSFDKCLLATGARQVVPSSITVKDDAAERVSFFQTVGDFGRVQDVVDAGGRVVVVGDGLVASELACSIVKRGADSGAEAVQVTQEAGVLRASLPPYLSDCATKKVGESGVKVVTGVPVSTVDTAGDKVVVVLDNGERLLADLVVLAAAESPNVDFGAGVLEVDHESGGFVVNQELQARSGVFAAGDVASFYDSALGRRRLSHYDHAYESGIVAGRNMTGDSQAYAYQPMHWGQLGDLEFYSVGACDAEPYNTVAFWAKPPEKHRLPMEAEPGQEYKRGVIYYLRPDNVVMGVLLWGMRPKSSDLESMRRLIYKNSQPFYHVDQLKDRITLQDWTDEEYEAALGPPVEADPEAPSENTSEAEAAESE